VLGDDGGREAAPLWRVKQLEYTFRLTAMGQYEDLGWVTERALGFALAALGARLPAGQSWLSYMTACGRSRTPPRRCALAGSGHELAVLFNGTPAMIGNYLASSGLANSPATGPASMRSGCSSRRPWCTGTRRSGRPCRPGGSGS
jgi:2-haloacid dehalogenase